MKNVKTTIVTTVTEAALDAAQAQQIAVPGEAVAAELIRGLAHEMLAGRDQLTRIDKHIAEVLERHPDAALIRSLPGMEATLTAEFLAITAGSTATPTATSSPPRQASPRCADNPARSATCGGLAVATKH